MIGAFFFFLFGELRFGFGERVNDLMLQVQKNNCEHLWSLCKKSPDFVDSDLTCENTALTCTSWRALSVQRVHQPQDKHRSQFVSRTGSAAPLI